MAERSRFIRRRALHIRQNENSPLYLFCLTGAEILEIAEISRITKDDAGKLVGYQRPEVRQHVNQITEYLDQEKILFPNAIILAVASTVRFTGSRGPQVDDGLAAAGILEIPLPKPGDHRPAWIVDGQQRVVAISRSKRQDFPVPVAAFVSDEVELQRDQFLRVNNTRSLPIGLITELLPEVSTLLPPKLAAKKVPSALCNVLSARKDSPFFRLIKRPSTPPEERGTAVITDTSVVEMLQFSLTSTSGCLFPYRNLATGETDFEGILHLVITYWTAVKETFPDAWGKSPARSRLMHGVGIRSMGRLMDRIMNSIDLHNSLCIGKVREELDSIRPICRWTSGRWSELDGRPWNDIQNVPQDIRKLSNLLVRTYLQKRKETV